MLVRDFLEASDVVLRLLENNDYSKKTINEHIRSVTYFKKCFPEGLEEITKSFVDDWLSDIRNSKSKDCFIRYQRSIYRIILYMMIGGIKPSNLFESTIYTSFSESGLNGTYLDLYCRFMKLMMSSLSACTVYHYNVPLIEFLLMLQNAGIDKPELVDIDHIYEYKNYVDQKKISEDKRCRSYSAVSNFIRFVSQGKLPRCYEKYLGVINKATDIPMLTQEERTAFEYAFHPSLKLDKSAELFIAKLKENNYSYDVESHRYWSLTHFFIYLELNHIDFTEDSVRVWESKIKPLTNKQKNCTVHWFFEFYHYGTINEMRIFEKQSGIVSLPEWSRNILTRCLSSKKREGLEKSTIDLYRSTGIRLFRFFEDNNIRSCEDISPESLIEFQRQDKHLTSEGKSAGQAKLRKILQFMADEDLIPLNYPLTVFSCVSSPVKIPNILSEDMIKAIYDYRNKITSPCQYRNMAMLTIGLRTGLRCSDIAELKFSNISFEKMSISLVQKKTGKPISVPLPVDAANSVYLYITKARPEPAKGYEEYVFLKAIAPYRKASKGSVRTFLRSLLKEYGYILPYKENFHILRRTFATQLLNSSAGVDTITDALGHSDRLSVNKYLSADEKNMRHCAIPLNTIGEFLYERV